MDAVVVGRSNIVGKPMAQPLQMRVAPLPLRIPELKLRTSCWTG